MSTTMTTTSLGTSNLRSSSSRQTRNLPARTSRNARPNLRQNSLISNPASAQVQVSGVPQAEPHGFYPAITHFTDAITALPRDFRRHTSLMKEVDAKAWALEENLQKLLKKCLHERQTRPTTSAAHTIAGSVSSVAGDLPVGSAAGSINGNVLDTASQYSNASIDPEVLRRRRLYHELRSNLMQMIMPLDEKNHVINNANEELSRHIRRQDEIWPHIADEISEETRLGSLRHWALTDLNPTKKTQAAAARGRELALAQDNEVAERSERRREAMALAKKQKNAQLVDSDAEVRKLSRKGMSKKEKEMEDTVNSSSVAYASSVSLTNTNIKAIKGRIAANKKNEETVKKLGTPAASGGIAMSRENSQQEISKKRKAPAPAITVARKRINAAQDSPKLGHSPLLGSFGKETHKKSPAFSNSKPITGRGRQDSAQSGEASNRPASAASRRNGVTATGSEMERVATATGKTPNEVKQTMRETTNTKGEKMLEEDIPDSVNNRIRGGIALERSASKSSLLRREANRDNETVGRRTASPRLNAAVSADGTREKNGKAKANKTSTPIVGTFAEAEANESAAEATSTAERNNELSLKAKRPVRPRMKDHHGLHDSLSPKGLPTKRTHKKNSYSLTGSFSSSRNTKDREEEIPVTDRKASRANSRSVKTEPREGRNASSTPQIGGPTTELVDEPESLTSAHSDDVKPMSRRQSQNPKHSNQSTTSLDVKPPGASRATAAHNALHSATAGSPELKAETPQDLGSPGPDIVDAVDEEEEEDPNEQRYCYCNGVSYGEMVACDNENCAREWFHLECTGLRSLPPARSTWYCDECKGNMVR